MRKKGKLFISAVGLIFFQITVRALREEELGDDLCIVDDAKSWIEAAEYCKTTLSSHLYRLPDRNCSRFDKLLNSNITSIWVGEYKDEFTVTDQSLSYTLLEFCGMYKPDIGISQMIHYADCNEKKKYFCDSGGSTNSKVTWVDAVNACQSENTTLANAYVTSATNEYWVGRYKAWVHVGDVLPEARDIKKCVFCNREGSGWTLKTHACNNMKPFSCYKVSDSSDSTTMHTTTTVQDSSVNSVLYESSTRTKLGRTSTEHEGVSTEVIAGATNATKDSRSPDEDDGSIGVIAGTVTVGVLIIVLITGVLVWRHMRMNNKNRKKNETTEGTSDKNHMYYIDIETKENENSRKSCMQNKTLSSSQLIDGQYSSVDLYVISDNESEYPPYDQLHGSNQTSLGAQPLNTYDHIDTTVMDTKIAKLSDDGTGIASMESNGNLTGRRDHANISQVFGKQAQPYMTMTCPQYANEPLTEGHDLNVLSDNDSEYPSYDKLHGFNPNVIRKQHLNNYDHMNTVGETMHAVKLQDTDIKYYENGLVNIPNNEQFSEGQDQEDVNSMQLSGKHTQSSISGICPSAHSILSHPVDGEPHVYFTLSKE